MFAQDPYANLRRLVHLPAHAMKTFEINQPLATHYRLATCQEVECPRYANGWTLTFDLSDPEHVQAANTIRLKSGRSFTIGPIVGTTVTLSFPGGQRCFKAHHVPLERDPLMIVRGGDFRGNPRGESRVHTSGESFVDEWATDLGKLAHEQEKG